MTGEVGRIYKFYACSHMLIFLIKQPLKKLLLSLFTLKYLQGFFVYVCGFGFVCFFLPEVLSNNVPCWEVLQPLISNKIILLHEILYYFCTFWETCVWLCAEFLELTEALKNA